MSRDKFYEGCGREGPIRCIFLCEFHPVAGPKITCQIPEGYISKDVFESINVYAIPKTPLFHNIITVTVSNFKILGYPARIDDNKYERNAYCFNLCFVFDSWARSVQYEPILKKLTNHLISMEVDSRFLSNQGNGDNRTMLKNTLAQIMNDLNVKKICILSEGRSTTCLKVLPLSREPPPILDHEVPVFIESSEYFQSDQWDLTTNQILPYINGVNHVAKIAAAADVDNNLVKSCLSNLSLLDVIPALKLTQNQTYHGMICMTPIFHYGNVYCATSKLNHLACDKKIQEDCTAAVSRHYRQSAEIRDIFSMYVSMKHGVTIKDLCLRFNPIDLRIDERNLVQFGVLRGFIRRIYKFPIARGKCAAGDYARYFTGEYSTDAICCMKGIPLKQLEEYIDRCDDIIYIYR